MKKMFLAAIGCMMIGSIQAREVTYNVYYNEITNTRGELYQYSERYLGTTDVIMADSHSYELDKIRIVMDENKNTATSSTAQTQRKESITVKEQLPLNEETLLAANLAKKAESVAKQIYHIRETRMNILSGDVEHMPADGKAMQLVLDELNRQEEALTSMFVGKSVVTNHRQSISINISDTEKEIATPLFWFSKTQGVLEQKADASDPAMLVVSRTTEQELIPEQSKKNHPVYTEKVVSSKTIITYLNQTIYAQTHNL